MRKLISILIVLTACSSKKENPLIGTWQLIQTGGPGSDYQFNPAFDKRKVYMWFKNDSVLEIRNEIKDDKSTRKYGYSNDSMYFIEEATSNKGFIKREGNTVRVSFANGLLVLKKVEE